MIAVIEPQIGLRRFSLNVYYTFIFANYLFAILLCTTQHVILIDHKGQNSTQAITRNTSESYDDVYNIVTRFVAHVIVRELH